MHWVYGHAGSIYIIGFRFDWLIGFLSINAPTPDHSLTHSHTSHNLRPHSQSLYDWLIINWPFSLPLLLLPGDDFGIGNEGNRKLNFVNASHYRLLFWHQVLLFVAFECAFNIWSLLKILWNPFSHTRITIKDHPRLTSVAQQAICALAKFFFARKCSQHHHETSIFFLCNSLQWLTPKCHLMYLYVPYTL